LLCSFRGVSPRSLEKLVLEIRGWGPSIWAASTHSKTFGQSDAQTKEMYLSPPKKYIYFLKCFVTATES
jgi:hypothetical protein